MSTAMTHATPRGYLERPRPSGLADVIDIILDKGLVVDAYVRVSLVGIELLVIDARIVVTEAEIAAAMRRLAETEHLMVEGAAGVALGTRFLLTSDSPVPDAVKQEYLKRTVNDTVVTSVLDGVPQRVLRTELVDQLINRGAASRLTRSVRHAVAFQKMSGTPWRDIVREGLAMKKTHELSWGQVIMAANTPMMLRSSMVDGRIDLGTLASGQVAGVIDDLPSCAELLQRIIAEAEAVLGRLQG